MTTSNSLSPPEPSKTPAGPTRPAMGNSEDVLQGAFSASTPVPDLASGAVICNRYRIQRALGKGGFGGVYLALDLELGRKVAIKRQIGRHLEDTELARNEAKFIAALDHPSIVKVFDLIDDKQEGVLIVMEYVNGHTLHELLRRNRVSIPRAIALAIDIVQALMHAHSRHIVHRDLKPSNVLLDPLEKVKLSDFGLALGSINLETSPSSAGTPKYMAPEQIRGESHRIDGRTDLWALGVILYEMLVGTHPFSGLSKGATFEAILYDEPASLRQLNPLVPEDIDRVVDRCLRKRMSERPMSAADLLDDLKACLVASKASELDGVAEASSNTQELHTPELSPKLRTGASSSHLRPLRVEPKGLRPYSEEDGANYLDLIPGPRERSGLPESVHFWKKWASCDNVDEYASVGVLYGPSGGGKTSFVRAGLLNQLDSDVCPIVIECHVGDLAGRIEAAIDSRFRQKSRHGSLSKLLSGLRNEEGGIHGYRKILIVLDQFESWSSGASLEDRRSLAESLRHCDGKVLQCLFVVRDDYWSGITEVMQWIDVPLVENRNVRSLELLDPRHAQRVLEGIGRAHGTLPPSPGALTEEQQGFIRQAVEGLAENGRVVAVHLVIFAQIVRVIPWTPQMLRKQGGVQGACSNYLHEIFETSAGPPAYRRLAGIVTEILCELLPSQGDPLRGSAKSLDFLRGRVRTASTGAKFSEAIRVLSEDLKLITPTHSELSDDLSAVDSVGYQLAHDFLVEPVRNWVELSRKSTWRGRAVTRLIELSDLWQRKPQTQFLPTLREYAAMTYVVPSSSRNEKQANYLRAAGRYHVGKAAGMTIATVVAVIFGVLALQQYFAKQVIARERAGLLFAILDHGSPEQVRSVLPELLKVKSDARAYWIQRLTWNDPKVRMRAALYSHLVGEPSYDVLARELGGAENDLAQEFMKAFEGAEAGKALRQTVADGDLPLEHRARAALILLHDGSTEGVEVLLKAKSNYAEREALISQAAWWRKSPTDIQPLLATAQSPDSQYVALAILGYFQKDQIASTVDWQRIEELRSPNSPKLYSAAESLLRRNEKATPPKEFPEGAQAKLLRSSNGLELVRVDAGKLQRKDKDGGIREVQIEKPLLAARFPIERRLYDKFLEQVKTTCDELPMPAIAPNPSLADEIEIHPERAIRGISHNRAVEFCNWLSESEGFTKAYLYGGKTAQLDVLDQPIEVHQWKQIANATGYRIPSLGEIEYLTFADSLAGSPWTPSEQIETVHRGRKMHWGISNPRLARDIFPNYFGLYYFDTDLYYFVYPEESVPGTAKPGTPQFMCIRGIKEQANHLATVIVVREAP